MGMAHFKKAFSIIFLGIFFVKMLLAVMPLFAHHIDKKSVYAVIMQLEIEQTSGKEAKETLKGDWYEKFCSQVFFQSHENVIKTSFIILDDEAVQAFYPSVATPPPNF